MSFNIDAGTLRLPTLRYSLQLIVAHGHTKQWWPLKEAKLARTHRVLEGHDTFPLGILYMWKVTWKPPQLPLRQAGVPCLSLHKKNIASAVLPAKGFTCSGTSVSAFSLRLDCREQNNGRERFNTNKARVEYVARQTDNMGSNISQKQTNCQLF